MTRYDIRDFRARHNFKQSDLARMLGIGVRMVAGYESGEYPIRKILELAIAQLERELEPPRRF